MVIGGETLDGRPVGVPPLPASTEPPMVIGGEVDVDRLAAADAIHASTEPPMVIGGEHWGLAWQPRRRTRFNGAADGDRRRGSSHFAPHAQAQRLQRSRRW